MDRAVWYGAVFAAAGILLLAHAAPAEANHLCGSYKKDPPHSWYLHHPEVDLCDSNLTPFDRTTVLPYASYPRIDLYHAKLSSQDMEGIALSGGRLSFADLGNAILIGANLSNTTLTGTYLYEANLIGADLRLAHGGDPFFVLADMDHAKLQGASLHYAKMYGASMRNANMSGADLRYAEMWKAPLHHADLSGANLTGAKFFINVTLGKFGDEAVCTHSYCSVHGIKLWYDRVRVISQVVEDVLTSVKGVAAKVAKAVGEKAVKNADTLVGTIANVRNAGVGDTARDAAELARSTRVSVTWSDIGNYAIPTKFTIKSNAPDVQFVLNLAKDEALKKIKERTPDWKGAALNATLDALELDPLSAAAARAAADGDISFKDTANVMRETDVPLLESLGNAGLRAVDITTMSGTDVAFTVAERLFGSDGEIFVAAGYLDHADLSGADLDGADMRHATVREADLEGVSLNEARLDKADLYMADLADSSLIGADLMGANLMGANLTDADLVLADLTAADLSGANMTRAWALWANLDMADMTGVHSPDAVLYGATLVGANLGRAVLADADLAMAAMYGADLTGADLTGARLTYADLTYADLTDATLTGALVCRGGLDGALKYDDEGVTYVNCEQECAHDSDSLAAMLHPGADLAGADLSYCGMAGADLHGAGLYDADLTGADLAGANLTDARMANFEVQMSAIPGDYAPADAASLAGADLTGAVLAGATMNEVDLSGATMFRANLTGANLIEAFLMDADLTLAELAGARLHSANLNGATICEGGLDEALDDYSDAGVTYVNCEQECAHDSDSLAAMLHPGADLAGADLSYCGMAGADLHGAGLYDADLTGADLHGAHLAGANLTDARMANFEVRIGPSDDDYAPADAASLAGANLTGAVLAGATMNKVDLEGAVLAGAGLHGANLRQASLVDANLALAELGGAIMFWANLTGASLAGANLAGANLYSADLDGATICEGGLAGILGTPVLTGVVYLPCDPTDTRPPQGTSPAPISAVFDGVGGFEALYGAEDVAVAQMSGHTYAVVTSIEGVQIIDITDPYAPAPAYAVFDGTGGFEALYGATGVAVTDISGHTYAVVTSYYDDGVQIIDITNPYAPAPVHAAFDGRDGFEALYGAEDVAVAQISGRAYAVVTSIEGVQIIDITDPYAPDPTSAVFDGTGGFEALYGATGVAVTDISGRTYAVLASHDGVQIIDITDPHDPATVFHGTGGFEALYGATGVAVAQISGRAYAVVTSYHDDGVQIIDITNPYAPAPVHAAFDGSYGFEALYGATGVAVAQMSGRTYAVVTYYDDNGVQIIDITNPYAPAQVYAAFDGRDGFEALSATTGVAAAQISGRTYAVVTSYHDDGVQIIDLGEAPAPSSPDTQPPQGISPVPVYAAFDGRDGFEALDGADGVAAAQISGHTYAIVTSYHDDGVQVIDITDPRAPTPTSSITDGTGGFEALDGANDVAIAQISGHTYAVVTAIDGGGVQVIDITDPYTPAPASAAFDGTDGFEMLDGADGIAIMQISGRTYAVVTAIWDDGVQVIDITDPRAPTPTSSITDGTGGFEALDWPENVAVTQISGRTYAVVASGDGVQVIDITDPYTPAPASAVFDDHDLALGGAEDVAVTQISGRTYAVVASDDGVQVIDITDPYTPAPASAAFDGTDGFEALGGAEDVAVTQISGRTYAVVTALSDDGVHVLDITDPYTPAPAYAAFDGTDGFEALDGANEVAIVQISGRTYAVVTSWHDDGVQIIDLGEAPAPSSPDTLPQGISPVPAYAVFDGAGGFTALDVAEDVAVTHMSGRTYAVVAAYGDNGVQIMDITDPYAPDPISAVFDDTDGFEALGGIFGVATTQISGRIYAVAAAYGDNGVQIMDITDPYAPDPISAVFDDTDGFEALYGAREVATTQISDRTYAVAAAKDDDGVQIIDITDPYAPSPAYAAFDGRGGFEALGDAREVATTQISGRTYAVVASYTDDGVQIIDITDPYAPSPAYAAFDGRGGFEALGGAHGVATTQISGRTYAVVASWHDGVQIIDITDPRAPVPAAAVFDGRGGFEAMNNPNSVAITQVSGHTYAVVTAWNDDGVQIIDITDPYAPSPAYAAFDGRGGFEALDGAAGVATTQISGRTYAVVTAYYGDGVQIIDLESSVASAPSTDASVPPSGTLPPQGISPVPVYAVFDGTDGFEALDRTNEVATTQISGRTYAVVTASYDEGVQIIDISDPYAPTPAAAIRDGTDGFTDLTNTVGVATTQISGRAYAVVTSTDDEGVQIIDISDPYAPTPAAAIRDGEDGFTELRAAWGVATTHISGRAYAVVTDALDGVQIIDISDPYAPTPAAAIRDGEDGFTELDRTVGVATTQISGRAYAVVTSSNDDGVQIIDISDPYAPTPAAAIRDGEDGFTELDWAEDVAIAQISGRTYAVVTAHIDDGVQIVDISDPYAPTPAAAIRDGEDGFTELDRPTDVAIAQISGRTYAVVASTDDDGVQVIDISDPYAPTPAAAIRDGEDGFTELDMARGVAITQISGRTYAVTTSWSEGVQIIGLG